MVWQVQITLLAAGTNTLRRHRGRRAYAWLLLDVMQGNQTLFARADWIDKA